MLLHDSRVKISSLHADAFISCDSVLNPIVYLAGDKLTLEENWKKGELILITARNINSSPGGDYELNGIWNEIVESYIGIRLNEIQLGWIKVDVSPYLIKIYEYAISG